MTEPGGGVRLWQSSKKSVPVSHLFGDITHTLDLKDSRYAEDPQMYNLNDNPGSPSRLAYPTAW